ncbi:MAG: AraC family transcriptional regulator [Spirochaetaceae bacterium]|nr:AraC family transcriptional regulator [Spirochaetaceae bacterium]
MRERSWFSQYFWSYLAVGIFPLLMGFIFYYMNIVTVEREVADGRFSVLEQVKREMDYISNEMRNIAGYFSEYLEGQTDLSSLSAADRDIICQRLKFYEESLTFSTEILLFVRGDTRLYTSEGIVPYHVFEADHGKDGDLTMSRFYSQINSRRSNFSFRLSPGFFGGAGRATSAVYLYPLSYPDMIPHGTLCFIFSSESIQGILENYLGDDLQGDLYLFNEMLTPLYSRMTLTLPEDFLKDLVRLKGVGVQEQRIGGLRYILMRSVSETTGASLVTIIRRGHFYARIRWMKIILLGSIVLLELLVIVFASAMSRRNYEPIRGLLKKIGAVRGKYRRAKENEFDFILDQVHSLEKDNLKLQDVLDRQQPLVAYSCIRSLLGGDFDSIEEMEYYLQYVGMDLSLPWFFVLIVAPVHEEGTAANGGGEKRSLGSRIRMIISAAEEGKIQVPCRLYALEIIPEKYVAVIVNSAEREIGGEDIRRFTAGILTWKISSSFNVQVKIGSGQIYDSLSKINASFLEAKSVMSEYLLRKSQVLLYEEEKAGAEAYHYPVIEQSQYLQDVRQANAEAALKALDTMIAKAAKAEAALVIQCLYFDIINTMMKAAGQINSGIPLGELKDLTTFTDMEQFRQAAREITVHICRQSGEKRKEKDSRLKSEILDYIHENFRRVQFSLQDMADHFALSVTYLSHFFKQETGENFIDYVSALRLETVKKELVGTDKQIKEIVYDVGYIDVASFIRKFKAQEGITPGQYRERMYKNKETPNT